ncbi:MAG TPA: hypothetical protein VHV57_19855 [Acidimicrobiales bacterium]|jgi:hypothetical protein|nr:hypothetical protein [Acidimicrobiales bacterium]
MVGHTLQLIGTLQPHPTSTGKLIFLVLLVIFFSVLFVASYIWMRRPDFGQQGARHQGVERSGHTN